MKIKWLGPHNETISQHLIDHEIHQTENPVSNLSGYDLVVSFNYKHIISKPTLMTADCDVINIHISYLPFNRGAHPNFWAHYDGTPHGVTIHKVDSGVDTGPIIWQRLVAFAPHETTFALTHARLVTEAEQLFIDHIDQITGESLPATPQRGTGTHHKTADLPKEFLGWNCHIDKEILRLKTIEQTRLNHKLHIIDQIEAVRSRNNVNWMDLLRLAFKKSPKEAEQIMARINHDDTEISSLLKQLAE